MQELIDVRPLQHVHLVYGAVDLDRHYKVGVGDRLKRRSGDQSEHTLGRIGAVGLSAVLSMLFVGTIARSDFKDNASLKREFRQHDGRPTVDHVPRLMTEG